MSRNENISVSLRFRPLNHAELEDNESSIWAISKNTVSLKSEWNQYLIDCKKLTGQSRSYNYNFCYTSNDSNLLIYSTVAKSIIYASLEGYNGTIFAYGQTGSGKTYTMMGSESSQETIVKKRKIHSVSPSRRSFRENNLIPRLEMPREKGIILLALEDLFAAILNNYQRTYYLTCSYLEIYNEQVYDLLAENLNLRAEVLIVNEDADGFYVNGLSEHAINNIEEVLQWIKKGESNRKYAATAMNHHSSRSHTIFRINVTSIRVLPDTEDGSVTTESILNFVDLAGSERVSTLVDMVEKNRPGQKTENLLTEGKHINTSLFYLCQVINKLSEKSTSKADVHVPYRNSNLTKILSSSLGGNSLTSIICTATPILSQFEMTLSTLRFGGTAQNITNTVAANIKSNKNSELLKSYQKDLDLLRKELEDAHQGGKEIDDSNFQIRKQLEDRINKLNHLLIQENNVVSELEEEEKCDEVDEIWTNSSGYLRLDKRTGQKDKIYTKSSDFEDKGAVMFERMKAISMQNKAKIREIRDLTEAKGFLQDSKVNLKNELKKALDQCKQLSEKKKTLKEKYVNSHKENAVLAEKLRILELKNVGDLNLAKLKQLEKFYYKALDNTKDIKFMLKHVNDIGVCPVNSMELWKALDVPNDVDKIESGSDNSSLEFESSFYKSKRTTEISIDFNESSIVP